MDRREFLTTVGAAGGLALAARSAAAASAAPPLPKRRLGKTGVEVTALALGGFTGMKEPRTAKFDPVELAGAAIDAGIRYLDTAPAYNNGQTEPRAYHVDIFAPRGKPGWISFVAYSGGELTGNGTHGLDQVQWALGTDDAGPVEIWPERDGPLRAPVYAAPESRDRGDRLCGQPRVFFRYASGVVVKLDNGPISGAIFVGDKGRIVVDNDRFTCEPAELADEPLGATDPHLEVSDDHFQNWFDCIKSRNRPIADVEIGHRSAVICHLCNITRWVGRKLRWDPQKEVFPGDDEANKYLDRPKRKPYELPDPV